MVYMYQMAVLMLETRKDGESLRAVKDEPLPGASVSQFSQQPTTSKCDDPNRHVLLQFAKRVCT